MTDTEDKKPPKLTLVQKRAIDASVEISLSPPEDIAYQHTVFCQTCLPYRNPGDEVREWRRQQGRALMLIEAGQAYDPERQDYVKVGLPYGPKARLILAHLNAEALRQDSPIVAVEDSFTAFVGGYKTRSRRDAHRQGQRYANSKINSCACLLPLSGWCHRQCKNDPLATK
jgi:hypothetical protein